MEVKSFFIIINEQYLEKFVDSEIENKFRTNEWYDKNLLNGISIPKLTEKLKEAKIIEGNINLKSDLDRILKWERETKEIITLEIRVRSWKC